MEQLQGAELRGEPSERSHGGEPEGQIEGPRIYVASLSDYNAGLLHGRWLDASAEPDDLQAGIDEMLGASPTARRYGEVAEEWRIDDFDGWGRFVDISGFESLETVARLARGLAEHGDAFGAWLQVIGVNDDEATAQFEEHYLGQFSSREEFGEQQLEGLGIDIEELPGVVEGLRPYIHVDVAGWVRDMELGGDISIIESSDGIYVYWNP